MALTCTIDYLTALDPCVSCLSQARKEGLMIYLLEIALGTGHETATALEDSACFTCLSETQMMDVLVKILKDIFAERSTIDELAQASKCWDCATPKQRHGLIVKYLCQLAQAELSLPQ